MRAVSAPPMRPSTDASRKAWPTPVNTWNNLARRNARLHRLAGIRITDAGLAFHTVARQRGPLPVGPPRPLRRASGDRALAVDVPARSRTSETGVEAMWGGSAKCSCRSLDIAF